MQINRVLFWVTFGGLLVAPFIVFLVPYSMFFPFIVGKNFAFRVIIEVIFTLWIILCIRDRSYLPRPSLVMYATTAFIKSWFIASSADDNFASSGYLVGKEGFVCIAITPITNWYEYTNRLNIDET